MGKKEKAIEFIQKTFGPATASQLESLSESEYIAKSKSIISGFLGEKKAAEFDNFIN